MKDKVQIYLLDPSRTQWNRCWITGSDDMCYPCVNLKFHGHFVFFHLTKGISIVFPRPKGILVISWTWVLLYRYSIDWSVFNAPKHAKPEGSKIIEWFWGEIRMKSMLHDEAGGWDCVLIFKDYPERVLVPMFTKSRLDEWLIDYGICNWLPNSLLSCMIICWLYYDCVRCIFMKCFFE